MDRDPWQVMGLSRGASQDEIKEQWRRLCKQHHPDLQPEHLRQSSTQYFKEISGAYRALTAHFTAARAAAAAAGHPYASGYQRAWASGGQQSKFSNGVVGAVLVVPLVITGIWLARRFDEVTGASHWRPHGLLSPPDNPFLRDDLKPRTSSRGWWGDKPTKSAAAPS